MNTTDTTANVPADLVKGEQIIVTLTDDTEIRGTFVSINTKGLNFTVEGKPVTRAMSRIAAVTRPGDEGEGYTSADLADMFDTSARALRKRLRSLGLGVGKGKRYALTDADLDRVRASVEGEPIED